METVKFTQMKDGDREDYVFLAKHETEFAAGVADRLLEAMVDLDKSLSGYQVVWGILFGRRRGHGGRVATQIASPRCSTT
jgi:hypothetical protein